MITVAAIETLICQPFDICEVLEMYTIFLTDNILMVTDIFVL